MSAKIQRDLCLEKKVFVYKQTCVYGALYVGEAFGKSDHEALLGTWTKPEQCPGQLLLCGARMS